MSHLLFVNLLTIGLQCKVGFMLPFACGDSYQSGDFLLVPNEIYSYQLFSKDNTSA